MTGPAARSLTPSVVRVEHALSEPRPFTGRNLSRTARPGPIRRQRASAPMSASRTGRSPRSMAVETQFLFRGDGRVRRGTQEPRQGRGGDPAPSACLLRSTPPQPPARVRATRPAPKDRWQTPPSTTPTAAPRTLVRKIWDDHVVLEEPGAPTVIGIDLHLVHEVTSPQAFEGLRKRGLTVRHPERTVATTDHSTPTTAGRAAHPRPAGGVPGQPAGAQLRRVRRPALQPRLGQAGHRPRHRAGAGPDAAGHDHRVRRLPHRDPRRVRCARVRHRHQRGGDGAGDADAAPAAAEVVSRST